MKKRLIIVLSVMLAVVLALTAFLIVRAVRLNRPPSLEALRPRIVALVDASAKVNDIFWGEGLPTYERVYRTYYPRVDFYLTETPTGYAYSETETALKLQYYTFTDTAVGQIVAYRYCLRQELKDGAYSYVDVEGKNALTYLDYTRYRYVKKDTTPVDGATFVLNGCYYTALPDYVEREAEFYYSEADDKYYDYVRFDAEYAHTDELKSLAEQVYAKDYLKSVYESMFTGIAVEGSGGILYARYADKTDDEGKIRLTKSNLWKPIKTGRVFLFDTMRMSSEKKSNATDVYVEIDTYMPGNESEITTLTVALTLQDGSWFLNSPTF